MPIGIMAAMHEEIEPLLKALSPEAEVVDDGRRTYHSGCLWNTPVVVVFSRWGKVAAATTATHLISDFGVDEILSLASRERLSPDSKSATSSLRIGSGNTTWMLASCLRGMRSLYLAVVRLPATKRDATNSFRPPRLSSATICLGRPPRPREPRFIFKLLRPSRETSPAATNFSQTVLIFPLCFSAYRP